VRGRLFTLAEKDDGIFAWGMEITHHEGSAVVTYRYDPDTQKSAHSVHESADRARLLCSRLAGVPLILEWAEAEHSCT
jgi:hypothetical protein